MSEIGKPVLNDVMSEEYYDAEAGSYDESRGGLRRAQEAAAAIATLVPSGGRCLDVAGGTGIVSAELAAQGRSVFVLDGSAGMLGEAARRLPGRALRASAERLPVRDGSVELVTIIWMLNLLPNPLVDAVLAEAVRVLAPDGRLVLTVDKELSHSHVRHSDNDATERVTPLLADIGASAAGTATFRAPSPWGSAIGGDPEFRLAAFRRA
jgi:ubiquinone/menaquinone biosynthesis C-methylase UbiE